MVLNFYYAARTCLEFVIRMNMKEAKKPARFSNHLELKTKISILPPIVSVSYIQERFCDVFWCIEKLPTDINFVVTMSARNFTPNFRHLLSITLVRLHVLAYFLSHFQFPKLSSGQLVL